MGLSDALSDALLITKYPRTGSHSYRLCDTTREECECGHHWQSHLLNRNLNYWIFHIMARKPKASSTSSFTPITFIQCTLTSEEKKHLQDWMKKEAKNLDALVIDVLQSNHKMGFSYNDTNDSFVCSFTGKQDDCINASKCFTSHAKDYGTALWVGLYKFHVLWQKGVWEAVEDEEDFG